MIPNFTRIFNCFRPRAVTVINILGSTVCVLACSARSKFAGMETTPSISVWDAFRSGLEWTASVASRRRIVREVLWKRRKEQMWAIEAPLASHSTSAAACRLVKALWSSAVLHPALKHPQIWSIRAPARPNLWPQQFLWSPVWVLFQRLEIESVKLSRMRSHTDRVMVPSQLLISAADILWSFFYHEGQWS